MQARALKNSKIDFLWNAVIDEMLGDPQDKGLTGVRVKDTKTGELYTVECDGVFIAIGHKPNSDLFVNFLDTDDVGYIKTEPGTSRTSVEGVFAAGDIQDSVYRQAVTAAGSGCMAALDAERYLEALEA